MEDAIFTWRDGSIFSGTLKAVSDLMIGSIISKVGIKQNVTHNMRDGEAVKE